MLLSRAGRVAAAGTTASVPVNTVAPVISGTTTVGSTLSCTTGTWTNTTGISYAYQWKRGGSSIGSATASTYLLVSGDAGAAITCGVTATNAAGAGSEAVSNTLTIAGGFPLGAFTSGLVGAWSSRQLLGTASLGLKLNNGTTAADIGFASGNADSSAISTHTAGGDDFVDWFYDHSGNGRHLKATDTNRRMRIASSGTIDVQNGHPKVVVTSALQQYATDAFTAYTGNTISGYMVWAFGGTTANYARAFGANTAFAGQDSESSASASCLLREGTGTNLFGYRNNSQLTSGFSYGSNGTIQVVWWVFDGTNYVIEDATHSLTASSSGSFNFNTFLVFCSDYYAPSGDVGGVFCEGAVWTTAIGSTDRATIRNNARTYWGAP